MKDRLIGLDMNGWHDFAVRSWLRDRDGIDHFVPDGYTVDGGTLSRVVNVGDHGLMKRLERDHGLIRRLRWAL